MFGILWMITFLIINLLTLVFGILVSKKQEQDTKYFKRFRLIISIILFLAYSLNWFV